jgi:hypothetical protein
MKRILILFPISLILLSLTGCKKDTPVNEQNRIILSTDLWLPGELYLDEEFYYWLDPELIEGPIDPKEIWHGELNQNGRIETFTVFINGHEVIKQKVVCFGVGNICGVAYKQNADGTFTQSGFYLKRN